MYRSFSLAESWSILRPRLGNYGVFGVFSIRFYVHVDGFEDILNELPPSSDCVKPLYKKMRGIVFPLLEDGALFT